MNAKASIQKVQCLNPHTKGKINIDKNIYDLFSKAIFDVLKRDRLLTYTQLVKGIEDCFKKEKTKFSGSVSWYAVTIKLDMTARGIIEMITEKGKKLHRLSK